MMIKRHIAILFLCSACAFLIGHSVVPHHHHEIASGLVSHHATDHHRHCDQNDIDPDQSYFHFVVGNHTVTIQKSSVRPVFFKDIPAVAGMLSCALTTVGSGLITSYTDPGYVQKAYCSAHVPASGSRGPPA